DNSHLRYSFSELALIPELRAFQEDTLGLLDPFGCKAGVALKILTPSVLG
ncbi:7873_t:CDS:2, partial [Scutellospora calospora]